MRYLLILLALLLISAPASAQECKGTCVPDEDMKKLVEVLKQRKCLDTEKPDYELDPVTIVIDKDGRIFFSGSEPSPYTLKMRWCGYEVIASGKVEVLAAIKEPPVWGFRFRPKAYLGVLPTEPFYGDSHEFADVTDAGAMVDFLFYQWANLNAAVGYRSVGAGLGIDLTSNFGLYTGYALTWGDWNHNANVSLWFSFWNP